MLDCRYSMAVASGPAKEPVTVADVKTHLRIDYAGEDAYLSTLIETCRRQAELRLRRSLITTTWMLTLDRFPAVIEFPLAPLQSVDSIAYVDVGGVTQILDASQYTVHADREPGRIYPAYSLSWPSVRDQIDAVTVTAKVGYGDDAEDVPSCIRHWILLAVGELYENRERSQESSLQPLGVADQLLSLEAWEHYP